MDRADLATTPPEVAAPDALASIDEGDRLDAAGDYAGAEAAYRQAIAELASADPGGSPVPLARAHLGLAGLCRFDGRLVEASGHVTTALGHARAAGDPALFVRCACEASLIDLEVDDLDAARGHATLAVDVALTIEEPRLRQAMLALALQARAAVGRVIGDYRMAEGDLDEAVRAAKRGFGPESLELAGILSDLGVVRKFAGRFRPSEIAHKRALGIVQRIGGPDHPDLATIEHNLGGLDFARGELAAAADHGRRSVALHTRSLGADHVLTALDRVALAAILDRLEQRDEARQLLATALPVLEATLGPEHREVAVACNNLAAIAHREGDLETAERWYVRALDIKDHGAAAGSPSVANTLVNLASVRRRQGRPGSAAALLDRAIAILEPSVEPSHPTLVLARRQRARLDTGPDEGHV
jgi:tetratricopeptide (TPR) repeat protein